MQQRFAVNFSHHPLDIIIPRSFSIKDLSNTLQLAVCRVTRLISY